MKEIKGIKLDGRVLLAPMAGVTFLPYREFMKPFGVAMSFSEMISDMGLCYGNKETFTYLKTSQKDKPVALQLFGHDVNYTKKAIMILEEQADYDMLDLNFGCPVPKVTKTGAGSAWLKRPSDLYFYVREIVKVSHKPVSCKIRLGWDSQHINFKEVSKLLEEAGASLLTIHGRTTSELYRGKAHYDLLKDFGDSLNIPLAISGDIYDPAFAVEMMNYTKASYIMVARGGIGNPVLISNINKILKGEPLLPSYDKKQQAEAALKLLEMMENYYQNERKTVSISRGLLPHFFTGFKGYHALRDELIKCSISLANLQSFLRNLINE